MAIKQERFKIHDFAGLAAEELRRTTSKETKSRVSLTYKSDPRFANLDPGEILGGPAAAAKKVIQEQICAIAVRASEATILKRKYARNALTRGDAKAKKRYDGGRSGKTYTPGGSDHGGGDMLFNDSGRLADGIFVRAQKDGSLTINVPANRFDPDTFEGAYLSGGGLDRMMQRLRELVPALRSVDDLMNEVDISDSIKRIQILQKDDPMARLRDAAGNVVDSAQELGAATGDLAGDEG
jgi:hypothetical protein